jgi:hypothetical protein
MSLKKMSALLLAAGVMASAQAAEQKSGAAAEQKPDDIVCTYEKKTGSHLKQRICTTRAERDEIARQDQEALRKFKSGSGARGAGNTDPAL